jgi:aminoglycoside phosphotransferase family enzyme
VVPPDTCHAATPTLAEKVAFLSTSAAYPDEPGLVTRRETHMSWVFFADDTVYKLKKPVRLSYLDFSTLPRREAACRDEVALNQRLAPGVYLDVVTLTHTCAGLALDGQGEVVDWLVRMRRLDESRTLEAQLRAGRAADLDVGGLADLLARFYRHAPAVRRSPATHLAKWRALLGETHRVLLDPRLGLPSGLVRNVLAIQDRFLRTRATMLARRCVDARIIEAHGDLRPEHVWMGPPVKIIDRLEFSAELRTVDWADELASLEVEMERLGAVAAGLRLRLRALAALHDTPPAELYLFYRIYRALLRARFAIAHLLEPEPRTPEKWPKQARDYLAIAARDARQLQRRLKRPADR